MTNKIRKIDKELIYNCARSTFRLQFPQLSDEQVDKMTGHLVPLMCRKIAKTKKYREEEIVTIQAIRDAFGAVLAERILHEEIELGESTPTTEISARIIRNPSEEDDNPPPSANPSTPPLPSSFTIPASK